MSRFNITPPAADHLRAMLAGHRGTRVIGIYWEGPKVELSRGADGEAQWERLAEGEWKVVLAPAAEAEGHSPDVVAGLDVYVVNYPRHVKIDDHIVDLVDNNLVVLPPQNRAI
jgi:hypothetical protein